MTKQYIFRMKQKDDFTTLPNELLENKRLTWEARGLLCYLLSKKGDWKVRMSDLENMSPSGRKVVKRIIDELEEANYIYRKKTRNDKGQWEWITFVFDTPQDTGSNTTTPPRSAVDETTPPKPVDGSSVDGKRGDLTNTESTNTNTAKAENPKTEPDPQTAKALEGIREVSVRSNIDINDSEKDLDIVDGILAYSKPADSPDLIIVDHYPADVQDIIKFVAKKWGFRVPDKKDSKKGYWIKKAREIKKECGARENVVLGEAWRAWEEHKERNDGDEPYEFVQDIGSIVSWFKTVARKIRQGEDVTRSDHKPQDLLDY